MFRTYYTLLCTVLLRVERAEIENFHGPVLQIEEHKGPCLHASVLSRMAVVSHRKYLLFPKESGSVEQLETLRESQPSLRTLSEAQRSKQ